MRIIILSLFMCLSLITTAESNVEVNAKYLTDNENYIYMLTQSEKLKIKKAELTKEGVKQILKNKDKKMTLFIPEKSIVHRKPLEK